MHCNVRWKIFPLVATIISNSLIQITVRVAFGKERITHLCSGIRTVSAAARNRIKKRSVRRGVSRFYTLYIYLQFASRKEYIINGSPTSTETYINKNVSIISSNRSHGDDYQKLHLYHSLLHEFPRDSRERDSRSCVAKILPERMSKSIALFAMNELSNTWIYILIMQHVNLIRRISKRDRAGARHTCLQTLKKRILNPMSWHEGSIFTDAVTITFFHKTRRQKKNLADNNRSLSTRFIVSGELTAPLMCV